MSACKLSCPLFWFVCFVLLSVFSLIIPYVRDQGPIPIVLVCGIGVVRSGLSSIVQHCTLTLGILCSLTVSVSLVVQPSIWHSSAQSIACTCTCHDNILFNFTTYLFGMVDDLYLKITHNRFGIHRIKYG